MVSLPSQWVSQALAVRRARARTCQQQQNNRARCGPGFGAGGPGPLDVRATLGGKSLETHVARQEWRPLDDRRSPFFGNAITPEVAGRGGS